MTKIEIQEYTEQKCPYCKSKDLWYDSYEFIEDFIKQNATCNKCKKEFTFWADKPQFWEVHNKEN